MSWNLCAGCREKHGDWAWKYANGGWYCSAHFTPSGTREMIPEYIDDQRKEYFNSTVQPYRGDELSKEFVEAHPQEAVKMVREGAVSQREVDRSRYVWSDLKGFDTRSRSK